MRMQPLGIMILPKRLRETSYYMCREECDQHRLKIQARRSKYKHQSIFQELYKTLQGICPYCSEYLELDQGGAIELHHKYPLKKCVTQEQMRIAKHKVNLCLPK